LQQRYGFSWDGSVCQAQASHPSGFDDFAIRIAARSPRGPRALARSGGGEGGFDWGIRFLKLLAGRLRIIAAIGELRRADPIMKEMLGPALRELDKMSPGCQAADLMLCAAYHQAKAEHGEVPERPIEDSDFARADAPITSDEIPTFRLPIGRQVFESLKTELFMEAEARRKFAHEVLRQSRLRRT
jgi:hypothetical protein